MLRSRFPNWLMTAGLLLVVCSAPLCLEAEESAAEVGQAAPEFSLVDESGTTHKLSQYSGKIVVLEWTNPDCPFVKRHYRSDTMEKLSTNDNVVWLAVDSTHYNKPEKSREWREEEGFEYPVLQDPSGEVGRAYGAKTTPHMFVIDAKGVLIYSGAIDDDPRGRSDDPKNYVALALAATQAGEAPIASETEPYGCSVKYAKR